MAVLAASCVAVGLFAPWIVGALEPTVRQVVGGHGLALSRPIAGADAVFGSTQQIMLAITAVSGALVALAGLLAFWRQRLLAARPVESAGTWDCGYAAPTPRMQYTASSFAQPLVRLFAVALQTRREAPTIRWPFPDTVRFHTDTPDVVRLRIFAPIYAGMRWAAARLRWIQHGNLQLYVLYIALTVIVLMVWKLG